MNNWFSRAKAQLLPYWQVSFHCSRQYRRVMWFSIPLYSLLHLSTSLAILTQSGKLPASANYLPAQHGLLLKFGDINRIVRLQEISRFESVGNHAAVYTPFGKSFILSSLSRIESRLDPQLFFKTSRADIIRIDAIRQLEPGIASGTMLAELLDGSMVEVSRRQMQNLKLLFGGI
jgi:two-component system LytT family response regulator